MIRLPAEPAQEDGVVKKRRATKRSAPKARKAAKKTARTASKKGTRKAKPAGRSVRRASARKAKPAARKVARTAVKKAPKKRGSARKAPARKGFVARPVPVTTVAAGAAASGEVYGEEGWREEELSAAELDTSGPELEAELEGPEITSETDDDAEW